ncbi:MAG TPA: hypothetical protein VMR41_06210 [Patescibacteria group bacterium]|nr:hypothetical protein [Patescibacteria group bacterium]
MATPIERARYREALVEAVPSQQFVVVKNGIDIIKNPHDPGRKRPKGFLYEEACFDHITQDSTTTAVIGPHLTDKLLTIPDSTKYEILPDGFQFHVLPSYTWSLKQIYEMKSGNNLQLERKLNGFSSLLMRLRSNPELLLHLLEDLMASVTDQVELPESIEIPGDKKINVVFISPHEKNLRKDNLPPTHFNVSYLRVPLPDLPRLSTHEAYLNYVPAPFYDQ